MATQEARTRAAPVEAPAPPALAKSGFTFKLTKKITAHGEEIDTLTIREPTGKDIVEHGNPIKLDLTMSERNMMSQMVNLCAVPPSTINQLSGNDWNTLAFEILSRFFAPDLSGARVTTTV